MRRWSLEPWGRKSVTTLAGPLRTALQKVWVFRFLGPGAPQLAGRDSPGTGGENPGRPAPGGKGAWGRGRSGGAATSKGPIPDRGTTWGVHPPSLFIIACGGPVTDLATLPQSHIDHSACGPTLRALRAVWGGYSSHDSVCVLPSLCTEFVSHCLWKLRARFGDGCG